MIVNITIEDRNGQRREIEVPDDMSLSLMEALKAHEYEILATCGGMALCATCHVIVVDGMDKLPPVNDTELDMLDTLPDATSESRLACQLRISEAMHGSIFRLGNDE